MDETFHVLIIEDHIAIIESYERALSHLSSKKNFVFKIDTATNCDDAISKMEHAIKTNPYDLIFLDISLPPSRDHTLLSGEDLGLEIRRLFDNAKIIVSTHYGNNYRINNIFNSFNPEGFLIKSEAGFNDFLTAIEHVLNGIPYYTKTVLELFRKHFYNELNLDKKDRQLLFEISKGTKMKDLPNLIHLSIGGVEQRKRKLKQAFNIVNGGDDALISQAEKYGFL